MKQTTICPMKRTSATNLLIAVCMICSAGGAHAHLKSNQPANVCSYLAKDQLPTRPWVAEDATYGGCASAYREIGTATAGIPNNLAYYAVGSASSATELELVLNLNQPQSEDAAIQELLKTAKALSVNATDRPLPAAIAQAITSRKGDVKAMNGTVEILTIRKNWPSGKGYEMHVVFK